MNALEAAATRRTIRILRARAHLAVAQLWLDDLTGELTPDQRARYEHDFDTFARAANQLAEHLPQPSPTGFR